MKKRQPCAVARHGCDQQQADGDDICTVCGWKAKDHKRGPKKCARSTKPESEELIDLLAVEEWVRRWADSVDDGKDLTLGCPWGNVARAYLALTAQLAERDKTIAGLEDLLAECVANR